MSFQPIYISYPSWEEPGPLSETREEAQAWLDAKLGQKYDRRDWGYVVDCEAKKQLEHGPKE